MKKKKLMIIIRSIIVIIGAIFLLFCSGLNINGHEYIVGVNNKELNEDINSIMSYGKVVNAKIDHSDHSTYDIVYKGDGYTIVERIGGDCMEFQIYHGKKLTWEYTYVVPVTTVP